MPGLRLGAWLLPRGRRLVRGKRQGQGRALLQGGPGAGTESRKGAGFPIMVLGVWPWVSPGAGEMARETAPDSSLSFGSCDERCYEH